MNTAQKNKMVIRDFLEEAHTNGDVSMQELADMVTDVIRDTDMLCDLISSISDNRVEQLRDLREPNDVESQQIYQKELIKLDGASDQMGEILFVDKQK